MGAEPVQVGTTFRTPFCHAFKTRERLYVYDVNTSQIIAVEPGLWQALRLLETGASDRLDEDALSDLLGEELGRQLVRIRRARDEDRLLLPWRPSPSTPHLRIEEVSAALPGPSGIRQVTLGVTHSCNMRCTYCTFSDKYPLWQAYSSDTMTWETAERAVDYFLPMMRCEAGPTHGPDSAPPFFSFYGGEPLLCFGLLRRITEYVEERAPGCCRYGITTNGTLLTPEVGDWLAEHAVRLLVSLDGPQAVHDRRRVFSKGDGTFQRIAENLSALKMAHPQYYARHVRMETVIDPDCVDEIACFVRDSELIPRPGLKVQFCSVALASDAYDGAPPVVWEDGQLPPDAQAFVDLAVKGCPAELTNVDVLRSNVWRYWVGVRAAYHRTVGLSPDPSRWYHTGPCIPGQKRVYVAPNGSLYPCPKPLSAPYRIGTVASGLDVASICRVVNDFHDLTRRECANCWAVRLCRLCEVHGALLADNDAARMKAICAEHRAAEHNYLVMLCSILERNPDALLEVAQPVDDCEAEPARLQAAPEP